MLFSVYFILVYFLRKKMLKIILKETRCAELEDFSVPENNYF